MSSSGFEKIAKLRRLLDKGKEKKILNKKKQEECSNKYNAYKLILDALEAKKRYIQGLQEENCAASRSVWAERSAEKEKRRAQKRTLRRLEVAHKTADQLVGCYKIVDRGHTDRCGGRRVGRSSHTVEYLVQSREDMERIRLKLETRLNREDGYHSQCEDPDEHPRDEPPRFCVESVLRGV
jgi:hypothetical protein